MNYVLRNKLLTPLEFLQEHFNPDPKTIQIIISCTFSPVQADMGTDCNKTHSWRWTYGGGLLEGLPDMESTVPHS